MRTITIEDFSWKVIDPRSKEGYYSLKKNNWEICIDFSFMSGWGVYLCNKFEEVMEEKTCICREIAVEIANVMYKKIK